MPDLSTLMVQLSPAERQELHTALYQMRLQSKVLPDFVNQRVGKAWTALQPIVEQGGAAVGLSDIKPADLPPSAAASFDMESLTPRGREAVGLPTWTSAPWQRFQEAAFEGPASLVTRAVTGLTPEQLESYRQSGIPKTTFDAVRAAYLGGVSRSVADIGLSPASLGFQIAGAFAGAVGGLATGAARSSLQYGEFFKAAQAAGATEQELLHLQQLSSAAANNARAAAQLARIIARVQAVSSAGVAASGVPAVVGGVQHGSVSEVTSGLTQVGIGALGTIPALRAGGVRGQVEATLRASLAESLKARPIVEVDAIRPTPPPVKQIAGSAVVTEIPKEQIAASPAASKATTPAAPKPAAVPTNELAPVREILLNIRSGGTSWEALSQEGLDLLFRNREAIEKALPKTGPLLRQRIEEQVAARTNAAARKTEAAPAAKTPPPPAPVIAPPSQADESKIQAKMVELTAVGIEPDRVTAEAAVARESRAKTPVSIPAMAPKVMAPTAPVAGRGLLVDNLTTQEIRNALGGKRTGLDSEDIAGLQKELATREAGSTAILEETQLKAAIHSPKEAAERGVPWGDVLSARKAVAAPKPQPVETPDSVVDTHIKRIQNEPVVEPRSKVPYEKRLAGRKSDLQAAVLENLQDMPEAERLTFASRLEAGVTAGRGQADELRRLAAADVPAGRQQGTGEWTVAKFQEGDVSRLSLENPVEPVERDVRHLMSGHSVKAVRAKDPITGKVLPIPEGITEEENVQLVEYAKDLKERLGVLLGPHREKGVDFVTDPDIRPEGYQEILDTYELLVIATGYRWKYQGKAKPVITAAGVVKSSGGELTQKVQQAISGKTGHIAKWPAERKLAEATKLEQAADIREKLAKAIRNVVRGISTNRREILPEELDKALQQIMEHMAAKKPLWHGISPHMWAEVKRRGLPAGTSLALTENHASIFGEITLEIPSSAVTSYAHTVDPVEVGESVGLPEVRTKVAIPASAINFGKSWAPEMTPEQRKTLPISVLGERSGTTIEEAEIEEANASFEAAAKSTAMPGPAVSKATLPNNYEHGKLGFAQQQPGTLRPEIVSQGITSTYDAIKAGLRTATSRQLKDVVHLRPGDSITITATGKPALRARVTQAAVPVRSLTPEAWSQPEGWTPDYVQKNPRVLDLHQIRFQLVETPKTPSTPATTPNLEGLKPTPGKPAAQPGHIVVSHRDLDGRQTWKQVPLSSIREPQEVRQVAKQLTKEDIPSMRKDFEQTERLLAANRERLQSDRENAELKSAVKRDEEYLKLLVDEARRIKEGRAPTPGLTEQKTARPTGEFMADMKARRAEVTPTLEPSAREAEAVRGMPPEGRFPMGAAMGEVSEKVSSTVAKTHAYGLQNHPEGADLLWQATTRLHPNATREQQFKVYNNAVRRYVEALTKAKDIGEKATALKTGLEYINSARPDVKQAGFAGRRPKKFDVPADLIQKAEQVSGQEEESLIQAAKKAGVHVYHKDSPAARAGRAWISPSGKYVVPADVTHNETADALLKMNTEGQPFTDRAHDAEFKLMDMRWIRRAAPGSYAIGKFTSKALDVISNDIIASEEKTPVIFVERPRVKTTARTVEEINEDREDWPDRATRYEELQVNYDDFIEKYNGDLNQVPAAEGLKQAAYDRAQARKGERGFITPDLLGIKGLQTAGEKAQKFLQKFTKGRFTLGLLTRLRLGNQGSIMAMSRDLVEERENMVNVQNYRAGKLAYELRRDVPKAERDVRKLGYVLQGSLTAEEASLSPAAIKALERIRKYNEGTVAILRMVYGNDIPLQDAENYLAQIWHLPEDKNARQGAAKRLLRDPFLKKKTIDSYKDGIEMGMSPKHDDIADIITVRSDYLAKAAANYQLATALKELGLTATDKMIKAYEDAGIIHDYVRAPDDTVLRNASYAGRTKRGAVILKDRPVYVRKDALAAVETIFSKGFTGDLYAAWDFFRATSKMLILGGTFFHHVALSEQGHGIFVGSGHPVKALKATFFMNPNFYRGAASGLLRLVGREGLTPPVFRTEHTADWLAHGLETRSRDSEGQVLRTLRERQSRLGKAVGGTVANLVGVWNSALWDFYHTGLMLEAANTLLADEIKKAGPDISRERLSDLKKAIARQVNYAFGAINFNRLLLTRKTQQLMDTMLLAPAWTSSNILAPAQLFEKVSQASEEPSKEGPRPSGRKFAASWAIGAALSFFLTTQALNYLWTDYYKMDGTDGIRGGHWTWQNPGAPAKIFGINLPFSENAINIGAGYNEDGTQRYIKFGRAYRETFLWMLEPSRTLGGKLGVLPKAVMTGLTGSQPGSGYREITSGIPFWSKKSLEQRAALAARSVLPIGLGDVFAKTLHEVSPETFQRPRGSTQYLSQPSGRGLNFETAVQTYLETIKANDWEGRLRIIDAIRANNMDLQQIAGTAYARRQAEIKQELGLPELRQKKYDEFGNRKFD